MYGKLCVTCVLVGSLCSALAFGQQWSATPSSAVQGAHAEIIAVAPAPSCTAALDGNLTGGVVVHVQDGFDVMLSAIKHSGRCELTIPVAVGQNALIGPARLTISTTNAGATTVVGYLTLTIASSLAGPVPPGISPQVDVMWEVVPYSIIRENYGSRIANNYIGVRMLLGNDSGFELLLSGIGFQPNGVDTPVPSVNQSLLQGTLAYGTDFSARNVIFRSLQWASLLTTGLIPFFKAPAAAANFATSVALFNGPIQNGYADQFPDKSLQQLQRLSNGAVMGDTNVIPNNTPVQYIAFVSRQTICGILTQGCGSTAKKDQPSVLRIQLGTLVLVGKVLPPANARFRVVTTPIASSNASGTLDTNPTEGATQQITIIGSGLAGASILQSLPASVTATAAGGGSDTSFPITIKADSLEPFNVVLKRLDGSLVNTAVSVSRVQLTPAPPTVKVGVATPVTISRGSLGPDLTGATVQVNGAGVAVSASSKASVSISINATAANPQLIDIIPNGFPAGCKDFEVTVDAHN